MEQLQKHTNSVFDLLDAHNRARDQKYHAFLASTTALVKSIVDPANPAVIDRTPYRNKKKHKHQQPQQLVVSNDNNTTNNTTINTTTTSSAAAVTGANASSVVPLAARPSRQAATKAMGSLKEPKLNSKMRHDVTVKMERISLHEPAKKHGSDDVAASADDAADDAAAEAENDPNAANRRLRDGGAATPTEQLAQAAARMSLHNVVETAAATVTTAATAAVPSVASALAMDESLIEMPAKETEIVSLTDDDDVSMPPPTPAPVVMPPPAPVAAVAEVAAAAALMPPPAAKPVAAPRKARTKKQMAAEAKTAAAAVRVKSEKLSLAATAAADVTDPPTGVRSTRSKRTKVPMPMFEVGSVKVEVEPVVVLETLTPVVLASAARPPTATANTTMESVYEDARAVSDEAAVEQPLQHHDEPMLELDPVSHIGPQSATVPCMPAATAPAEPADVFQADSTYVQQPMVADANATYVSNATFVQPNEPPAVNETFNMAATGATAVNETVCLGAAPAEVPPLPDTAVPPEPMYRASIMTEDCSDDSEDDRPLMPAKTQRPQPVPISSKHHKELFNPCVQSPLKQKVAAFERHAQQEVPSPAPVRTTRTKTRQQTVDAQPPPSGEASAVAKGLRTFLKAPSTPNLVWKSGLNAPAATGTPSTPSRQHGGSTASLPATAGAVGGTTYYSTQAPKRVGTSTGAGGAALSASTSKLAHLNRPASAVKASGRETSAEDVRRGLQEAADEKRRKREEKLKQVHLQREQREKERAEKYAKQLLEKEEKSRLEAERKRQLKERKDREAESKRALEEIQRNLKMQALKDAEQARAERELLEAERKEREQMDLQRIQVEKQVMQQKLKLNQQAMSKAAKSAKPTAGRYCFEMLNTDDETDDESHPVAGRPLPPSWSLRGNREERISSQSNLPIIFSQGFFASESMTPDLKELFPEISEKQLRRNSSAVWNTPPRYSTMDVPRYN